MCELEYESDWMIQMSNNMNIAYENISHFSNIREGMTEKKWLIVELFSVYFTSFYKIKNKLKIMWHLLILKAKKKKNVFWNQMDANFLESNTILPPKRKVPKLKTCLYKYKDNFLKRWHAELILRNYWFTNHSTTDLLSPKILKILIDVDQFNFFLQ